MHTRSLICLCFAAVLYPASADPPRREVEEANKLLQRGETDEAIQAYRGLQIDDPESELLYYNIGCAQLESAAPPDPEADSTLAIASLNSAKASLDKAVMAENATIRRDARFNRVNCDSGLAKHLALTPDFEGATSAFEDAIYGYEDFLDQYPDHAGAQQNLNHMRYLLKKMLQNPPPEQEQQEQESEDGEGEKGEDGEQQEQSNSDGEQQDGDDQGEKGDQKPSGEPGEQQPGDETQPEEGENQDQQPGEGESNDEQSGAGSEPGNEQQQAGDGQTDQDGTPEEGEIDLPNKDTIEAILDALQERDKEEQQNMRRVQQNPRRSGPWW